VAILTAGPQVRLQLLTAAMKLFFKRPPETRPLLGRLLSIAVADASHVDVHDRALFYYRLLARDVNAVRAVMRRTDREREYFCDCNSL
jgi:hypothetical protein